MSLLPLGRVHFFAFVQTGLPGQRVLLRQLSFWEGAGSVTRRTLENAACAPESLEHVLRKVKQLKRPAPSLLSCFPVDLGTWREEHSLRLCCAPCQRGFDGHPNELRGSHWRVLGARPHCKVASPRTRHTDNSSWLFRDSTSFHRFLASLFQAML